MLVMKELNHFETAVVIKSSDLCWIWIKTLVILVSLNYLNSSCVVCSLQTAEKLYILPINLMCNGGWIILIATVWCHYTNDLSRQHVTLNICVWGFWVEPPMLWTLSQCWRGEPQMLWTLSQCWRWGPLSLGHSLMLQGPAIEPQPLLNFISPVLAI